MCRHEPHALCTDRTQSPPGHDLAFVHSNRQWLTPECCAAQLVNYPEYRNHEMKALFEWLGRTGRELEVFCIRGPLDGKDYAVELTPRHDLGGLWQSVGFNVVS